MLYLFSQWVATNPGENNLKLAKINEHSFTTVEGMRSNTLNGWHAEIPAGLPHQKVFHRPTLVLVEVEHLARVCNETRDG